MKVYTDIAECEGYGPGRSSTDPKQGAAFVRDVIERGRDDGGSLRCLLVADDVWEAQVLVLVTTRSEEVVEHVGGTVMDIDRFTEKKANVYSKVLQSSQKVCHCHTRPE